MLEVGTFLLRTESELIIKSRRVVPTRLCQAGFQFRFPELPMAVADLERRLAARPAFSRNHANEIGALPRSLEKQAVR
jgi:uncharacterized protein DUF1731